MVLLLNSTYLLLIYRKAADLYILTLSFESLLLLVISSSRSFSVDSLDFYIENHIIYKQTGLFLLLNLIIFRLTFIATTFIVFIYTLLWILAMDIERYAVYRYYLFLPNERMEAQRG
jgi:hypothetical protein